MMAILRQKNGNPLPFENQAIVIYAAVNGYLAKVPVGRVPEYEEKMLRFIEAEAKSIPESIARAKDIAQQTEEELKVMLKKFEETHPDFFEVSSK